MPKAIRLKIFQQMPNYKKPAAVVLKESFPLPPYSTVIGMVHFACKFTEYHSMKVSIQGRHASDIAEIEKQYAFGSIPKDRCDIVFEDSPNGIRSGMKTIQFLTDVELCVHIVPDDESELEYIYSCLKNPPEYLCLGRWEDIARIDDVSIVELEEITDDNIEDYTADEFSKNEMYCPLDYLDGRIQSTIYKIPKVFAHNGNKREWTQVINSLCTPTKEVYDNEKLLMNENVYFDCENEKYIVILA